MKSLVTLIVTALAGVLLLSAVAPSLVSLSHALVPLIVAIGVVAIAVRLVVFHTRRW
jgi:hypothetical protein